jgi:hypothetical protein
LTSEIHLVTAATILEYERQLSDQQSDIYGLVTVKVSPSILSSNNQLLSSIRVPIDLICVVDQNGTKVIFSYCSRFMSNQCQFFLKNRIITEDAIFIL